MQTRGCSDGLLSSNGGTAQPYRDPNLVSETLTVSFNAALRQRQRALLHPEVLEQHMGFARRLGRRPRKALKRYK